MGNLDTCEKEVGLFGCLNNNSRQKKSGDKSYTMYVYILALPDKMANKILRVFR